MAKYNLPGLVAHQCALQVEIVLDIPDFGEPPKELELLSILRTYDCLGNPNPVNVLYISKGGNEIRSLLRKWLGDLK